jgi:hypothetical protein
MQQSINEVSATTSAHVYTTYTHLVLFTDCQQRVHLSVSMLQLDVFSDVHQ